jgi:iron complex outermembrane receptor protein
MGVSFDRKEIVSNDRGNHSNNNIAGFSSCLYNYKKLNITPGLRFLYDENYGFDYLPQLNIAYPLKHIIFRGGVGKSIRGADFTERYNNYNKPLVKSGSIGNPDLVAEKSWSYELGLDAHVSNFQFNATGFYRKQNQLIDFVNTKSNFIAHNQNLIVDSTYAYAINVSSIITKGLEFEAKYNVSLSSKAKLSFLSNLQFLHSTSSNPTPTYYILSHAKFLSQQTLILDMKHFNFSVTSLYKERTAQKTPENKPSYINATTSPAYWLVNAKVSYNYNLVNVFVSLNNIGDIQYSDLLGSKMPSRWLMSGINIHF